MDILEIPPKSAQSKPREDRAYFWQFCIQISNRIRLAQPDIATLTAYDIDKLLVDQKWRCAVSGIVFERPRGGADGKRHPFGPSLDRIQAGGPYEAGNVRLVCNIVNMAMNEWGETALLKLVREMSERRP